MKNRSRIKSDIFRENKLKKEEMSGKNASASQSERPSACRNPMFGISRARVMDIISTAFLDV